MRPELSSGVVGSIEFVEAICLKETIGRMVRSTLTIRFNRHLNDFTMSLITDIRFESNTFSYKTMNLYAARMARGLTNINSLQRVYKSHHRYPSRPLSSLHRFPLDCQRARRTSFSRGGAQKEQ